MKPAALSPFLRRLALLPLILLLAACSRAGLYQQESYVFGTRVDVVVYGNDEAQAQKAMSAVLREFDRLHRAYHAWQPSELTSLNKALAEGHSATVSPELSALLQDAQRLAALGDELFDPALGKLIGLWGFQSDTFEPRLPDPTAVDALLRDNPRMSDLHIDGLSVRSDNPAVQLDLGGYGKGYALDRAAEILHAEGIHNALINIGGNIMALGSKGDEPWRVGIQHPREPRPIASLPLYDGEAIGTSGDYQRFFELDGKRYCHLLDPRSGQPARGTQSLTVLVTPRPGVGTLSDAASKPAFIAGERWREYLTRYGIQHGLRVDEQGRIAVTRELRARLKFYDGSQADQVVN